MVVTRTINLFTVCKGSYPTIIHLCCLVDNNKVDAVSKFSVAIAVTNNHKKDGNRPSKIVATTVLSNVRLRLARQ